MPTLLAKVPDAELRQRALEPHASFIIQAPAGSGKTELLIQRYLKLLSQVPQAPEQIIALTFTRKAAAEMRDRVLHALQQADQPAPISAHARQTWQLAQAVLERDRQENWQLLSHPNRLRMQTIDSLCASITRQMPVLSHFGAQPHTTDNPDLLYTEAVQELLATLDDDVPWADDLALLLLHVDNDQAKLERLLVRMLAQREQWLPYLADAEHPELLRQHLENSLQQSITTHLTGLKTQIQCLPIAELLELLSFAAAHLPIAASASALSHCRELTALPNPAPAAVTNWLGIAELLLTKEGSWRKDINKNQGFPSADKTISKADKALWQAMKKRMKALLASCQAADHTLLQALAEVRLLPAARYSDQQWQTLQVLLNLLPVLVAHLQLRFQAHGQVDFTEIALRAQQALGSPLVPSDLALTLDYCIQHILIDEFQDTSISQFQLLEQLTAGWQADDGRTLFIVGDPMQSIYRFRKAEVSLFLRLWEQGLPHIHLEPLRLQANFRSIAAIINWNNQCFAQLLPQEADLNTGAVPFSPSLAVREQQQTTAAVQIHTLSSQQAEAAHIIELVQSQQGQGSIAILVRAKSHLAQIIPALQQANITYHAVELELLQQRPIIQDLLALTKALLHPADRIAWLSILRAPWCGLSLADLYALVGSNHQSTVLDAIANRERIKLSPDGKQRLERFAQIIEPTLQNYQCQPLAVWVESTWLALGGPACASHNSDLDHAMTFFNLLSSLQQGGWLTDTAVLEQRLEQLFADSASSSIEPSAGCPVQIMTIHKAKGLEFDTVILPGLQRKPSHDDEQLLLWQERLQPNGTLDLLLGTLKFHDHDRDAIYNYLRGQESKKQHYELGRLLYVAATRAKNNLHLLAVANSEYFAPAAGSFLAALWPQLKSEVKILTPAPKPTAIENTKPAAIQRLAADWQMPLLLPTLIASPPLNDAAIEMAIKHLDINANSWRHSGTLIHRMLYRISLEGHQQWPASRLTQCQVLWRQQLMSLGVAQSDLERCLQRIEQALQKTLTDPRGLWLLSPAHTQAQSEYGLTALEHEGYQQISIDRTFIDPQGIRWIVDYKTSELNAQEDLQNFLQREEKRYRRQLDNYAAIMRRTEERPIRLGLYFPLLSAWHEWDYAEE